jgi:hypothetical protein
MAAAEEANDAAVDGSGSAAAVHRMAGVIAIEQLGCSLSVARSLLLAARREDARRCDAAESLTAVLSLSLCFCFSFHCSSAALRQTDRQPIA